MSASKNIQSANLTGLTVLLESYSKSQLLAIIAEMIEYEPIDYQEMFNNELIAFITENYNYAIVAEVYKDEDEFVDWCFKIALEVKALEMSERFNKQQRANGIDADGHVNPTMYYCCLVYAISYFVKDFKLLDDIDRFVGTSTGYVETDKLTTIANQFNLAFRVRIIPKGRDKIEYMNKANNGWYGNPQTAKYCIELGQLDEHYVPWIEDIGITEYFLEHYHDVVSYAKSHSWSENKMFHTYKKNNNSFIADEKRKGMNVIRFMNKLIELGMSVPLKRNDKDVMAFMDFQDFKYHANHPRG